MALGKMNRFIDIVSSNPLTKDAEGFVKDARTADQTLSLLTIKATKAIVARYGGLQDLGEKLFKTENFEMALDELIWLLVLLANQSILIHNLKNKDTPKELLTEEELELLTSPLDLVAYKNAIIESILKGTVQMNMTADEFWTAPLGLFLDLWTCHKQFMGIEKPYREASIDDVIPI